MSGGAFPQFTSRLAFILVAAGAAVGLGNVWGFTYVAHKNGGAGFMLAYLAALLLIALPAFLSELVIGRIGRASPPRALHNVQQASGGSALDWRIYGWGGVGAALLILSFYMVIAGEAMAYGWTALTGGIKGWTPDAVKSLDQAYKATPVPGLFWGGLFIGVTIVICALDVRRGLERTGKILMPVLFAMLFLMVFYAAQTGDMVAALAFLFDPSDLKLSSGIMMEAMGQAFFTMSVGMGGIMLLGAYMGEEVNMAQAAIWVLIMDLAVAVLAGLIIFPIVYAVDAAVTPGPGLVFITLPTLFVDLPFGGLAAVVFFLLLSFAAITSSIALLAVPVAWLEDRGWSRLRASMVMGLLAYGLSVGSVFSFNVWKDFYPLAAFGFTSETVFELIREGVNNIILPIGGLAFAVIVGWKLPRGQVRTAIDVRSDTVFGLWYFAVRFIVPLAVSAIFVNALVGGD